MTISLTGDWHTAEIEFSRDQLCDRCRLESDPPAPQEGESLLARGSQFHSDM
jgi:hypothetical protein